MGTILDVRGGVFEGRIKGFEEVLMESNLYPLMSTGIKTFQVNVGRLCNQGCRHCHVDAGPDRPESMKRATFELCLRALSRTLVTRVDITGGAPEMNHHYRWFVRSLYERGLRVFTRTNLTILNEPDHRDLPGFWAACKVEVIASLPFYLEGTSDRQRGKGVFNGSLKALKTLNDAGYGVDGSGLVLNLVHNPAGAFLPPGQKQMEDDYRRELKKRYGVSFTNLYILTNMPVGRFFTFLECSGNLAPYMERLASSYNIEAAANVMCRNTISIGWDGFLYDCDFNQMLGLKCACGVPGHIEDFDPEVLDKRRVVTGPHCFGCTAGAGSSCTGEVV